MEIGKKRKNTRIFIEGMKKNPIFAVRKNNNEK